jgi:hypothetical protein
VKPQRDELEVLYKAFNRDHIAQMMFGHRIQYVSSALNFLAGFGLFAGGVGLMLGDRWGWRTVLIVTAVQIVHLLIAFVVFLTTAPIENLLVASNTHPSALLVVLEVAAIIPVWFFLLAQIILLTRIPPLGN